jgi:branched-chain amino acid transport system substrate-binding protein
MLRSAGIGLGLATLGGRARLARAEGEPIRIGYMGPLSGNQMDLGNRTRLGAEIAVKQVNKAGGLMGREVQLTSRDDQGSPNGAIAAFQDLSGSGIKLIGGISTSAPLLAVLPLLEPNNALLINIGGVTVAPTHEKYTPHLFRIIPGAYSGYRAQAKVMATRYPEIVRWGFIVPEGIGGEEEYKIFASGFRDFYPTIAKKEAVILEPVWVKGEASDFKVPLSQLMSQSPQGVVVGVLGGAGITLYAQGRALGWENDIKVFNDVGQELTLGKALGRRMPSALWSESYWYYPAHKDEPISKALHDDYVAATGSEEVWSHTGLGHMSMSALMTGIRVAKSTEPKAIMDALPGHEFQTVNGKTYFRKEDHAGIWNIGFIKMGPKPDAPDGWGVLDYVGVNINETIEPPSPGVPFKF